MIIAVLQARMSSSRLPGKVLMPILGRPMMALQIERVQRSRLIDKLVVATSNRPEDDAIASLCADLQVDCFRGDLNDVLQRCFLAVDAILPTNPATGQPSHVVRLTADCPLADPAVIDTVIRTHLDNHSDYCSNCHPPTFPDGLDVEVVRFECLQEASAQARDPFEREHVTPYIWRQPQRFRLANHAAKVDRSNLRWTVDEAEDLALIRQLFDRLYHDTPDFGYSELLRLIDAEPELTQINARHTRNAGCTPNSEAQHL